MYNKNGFIELTNFQFTLIFSAIIAFATGVLYYIWKTKGDSLVKENEDESSQISDHCLDVFYTKTNALYP